MIERLPRRFAAIPRPRLWARAVWPLEMSRGRRAASADPLEHTRDDLTVAFDPGMPLVLLAVSVHRVPEVGERFDRDDGRRVRPVLGEQPVRIVQRPE